MPKVVAKPIRHALIVANLLKAGAQATAEQVRSGIEAYGISSDVRYITRDVDDEAPVNEPDVAVSIGGDGTVLFTARILAGMGTPILPVNLGDFGFITEVGVDEWRQAFESYLSGALRVSRRLMLRVRLLRDGKEIVQRCALNDVVVSAAGISKLVRLQVFLEETEVGRYRSDGIIVATPTGSTAYSAAAGGPILNPDLDAVILNPICPFTLSHRPLVFPAGEALRVFVDRNQRTDLKLTVDGQMVFPVQPADEVRVEPLSDRARIIQSDRRSFYEVLRTKLNWSGGPND